MLEKNFGVDFFWVFILWWLQLAHALIRLKLTLIKNIFFYKPLWAKHTSFFQNRSFNWFLCFLKKFWMVGMEFVLGFFNHSKPIVDSSGGHLIKILGHFLNISDHCDPIFFLLQISKIISSIYFAFTKLFLETLVLRKSIKFVFNQF